MSEKKTTKTEEEKKTAPKKSTAKKTVEATEKHEATKKPTKKAAAEKTEKKAKNEPVAEEVAAQLEVEAGLDEIDDEVVELISESGESRKFFHVATIDYEDDWFVFFQPAEKMEDTDEDEVVVFRLDSDEQDNDLFLPVESEELLHKVYAEYVRLMEESEILNGGGCAPSACANCPSKCK